MEDKIKVMPAAPEDAQGMQEVSYYSWLATYPNEKAGITLDDIQERLKLALSEERVIKKAKMIAEVPNNEKYLVAKDGKKVVGICHLVKYDDKNQLQAIYVLPEYTGRGIGIMLWNEACKFFDPNKDISVEVAVYNEKAINFYKKLGFVDTGRIFSEERFRMKSGSIIVQTEMIIKAK